MRNGKSVQAVSQLACHAIGNVSAITSQAMPNPYLAYDGLRLLERVVSANGKCLSGKGSSQANQYLPPGFKCPIAWAEPAFARFIDFSAEIALRHH